jgi:iron(III) transport system ATP-binding protein
LKDGCLVQVGTADELYRKPRNLFAAGFFSEVNVFDARVHGGRVETPLGSVPAGEYEEGQPLSIAVRLSGVQLKEEGGDIPARIVSRRFLGVVELLELAVPQFERTVRARIRADLLPPGLRDVTLSVNERDILVFEKDATTS